MEFWYWAVIGGLAGTVLMDITAIAAEKLNITSGGRCGGPQVIGRWVFGIFDARFVHKNIIDSIPVKYEASAGWLALSLPYRWHLGADLSSLLRRS